jgi:hypothetical protein
MLSPLRGLSHNQTFQHAFVVKFISFYEFYYVLVLYPYKLNSILNQVESNKTRSSLRLHYRVELNFRVFKTMSERERLWKEATKSNHNLNK